MMNNYTHTGTDTLTVREYIVDYILPIYCQSLITYKNMRRILEESVLCDIGDIPADKLSIAQIAHSVEAMKNNSHLTKPTMKTVMSILAEVYILAVGNGRKEN